MRKENGPLGLTDAQKQHLKDSIAQQFDLAPGSVVIDEIHAEYSDEPGEARLQSILAGLEKQRAEGASYFSAGFFHVVTEFSGDYVFHVWENNASRMPVLDFYDNDSNPRDGRLENPVDDYTLITYTDDEVEFLPKQQVVTIRETVAQHISVFPDNISLVLSNRETVMCERPLLSKKGFPIDPDALYIRDEYIHDPSGTTGKVYYHIWDKDPSKGLVVDVILVDSRHRLSYLEDLPNAGENDE